MCIDKKRQKKHAEYICNQSETQNNKQQNNRKPRELDYRYNRDIRTIRNYSKSTMLIVYKAW